MTPDAAETLALQALAWIAADEDRLAAFMGETGIDQSQLRHMATNPEFLGAVLDHLLGREWLLTAFCAEIEAKPESPMRARRLLPGANPEM